MYNRVTVSTEVVDSGSTYTYTTVTTRQARASAGNQIQFVTGLAEDGISSSYATSVLTAAAAAAIVHWGIGLDSTTAFRSLSGTFQNAPATAVNFSGDIQSNIPAQIGFHTISANEGSDGVNANTFDSASLNNLSAQLRM
jgi:hypothetical protein